MKLFSKKSNDYLGVDIGSAGIKIVELRDDQGRSRLSTYGYSEYRSDVLAQDSKTDLSARAVLLKHIIAKAKSTSLKAVTALPTYAVFSSVLNFPAGLSKKDLPSAIRWEAKKVIPLPIEDMILDWKRLPDEGDDSSKVSTPKRPNHLFRNNLKKQDKSRGGYQKILLTGAPKNLVNKYVQIFKLAGLKLMSLETESFALVRSLIGSDPSPVMIVNFGAQTTTISMVEHSIPILNRSIDVGGSNLTKAIAKSLNINEERALQFKQDVGLADGGAGGSVPKMIAQALAPVVNEIKYTKNVWYNQFNKKMNKLVLTGGSSNLPQLAHFLSQEIDVRTFLGDPWARVIYPEDLKPVLNEVGPKLAVAVGLAMRNIE